MQQYFQRTHLFIANVTFILDKCKFFDFFVNFMLVLGVVLKKTPTFHSFFFAFFHKKK